MFFPILVKISSCVVVGRNISVNLKDAEAIAAGMIDIEYDKNLFTYEGAEYGRVEIDPVKDEDCVVSAFELPGYVRQLEVTVNK